MDPFDHDLSARQSSNDHLDSAFEARSSNPRISRTASARARNSRVDSAFRAYQFCAPLESRERMRDEIEPEEWESNFDDEAWDDDEDVDDKKPATIPDLLEDLDALDADNVSWQGKLSVIREAIIHRIVEDRETLFTFVLNALEAQLVEEHARQPGRIFPHPVAPTPAEPVPTVPDPDPISPKRAAEPADPRRLDVSNHRNIKNRRR
jgi:hypothetical protein